MWTIKTIIIWIILIANVGFAMSNEGQQIAIVDDNIYYDKCYFVRYYNKHSNEFYNPFWKQYSFFGKYWLHLGKGRIPFPQHVSLKFHGGESGKLILSGDQVKIRHTYLDVTNTQAGPFCSTSIWNWDYDKAFESVHRGDDNHFDMHRIYKTGNILNGKHTYDIMFQNYYVTHEAGDKLQYEYSHSGYFQFYSADERNCQKRAVSCKDLGNIPGPPF
jgi:hypothetical protein